jgi:uncharacterized protein (TIGR02145 family)
MTSRDKFAVAIWVIALGSAAAYFLHNKFSKPDNTMSDPRNGITYRTVTIGEQRWMAENLNYEIGTSWCSGDNPKNCQIYGRLYDWNTAVRACPDGWHLPSDAEWTTLENATGNNAFKLMDSVMLGTNNFGFKAIPAGDRYPSTGTFDGVGIAAMFWSATNAGDMSAVSRFLCTGCAQITSNQEDTRSGMSVRCVADH